MAKVLNANVFVDDKWYGPDYGPPPADVAEQLGAHLWDEDATQAAGVEGSTVEEAKPLDKRSKGELIDLAEAQDPPIDSSGTKADLLERLQAAGVEG